MRASYPSMSDAMPITFHAVAGKADTYTLKNVWTADTHYDYWISFTTSSDKNWVRSYYNEADALEVKFLPQDAGGE